MTAGVGNAVQAYREDARTEYLAYAQADPRDEYSRLASYPLPHGGNRLLHQLRHPVAVGAVREQGLVRFECDRCGPAQPRSRLTQQLEACTREPPPLAAPLLARL